MAAALDLQQFLYIMGGLAIAVLNTLIVGAIAKDKNLRRRKEYLVVGALAFADILFGVSYFGSGATRVHLRATNQDKVLHSTWECMLKPVSFFKLFGVQLASVMLLCASVDRLVAVLKPAWYFKQKLPYAKRLIGGFYLIGIANCCMMMYVSYSKRHTHFYPATCLGGHLVGMGVAGRCLIGSRMICSMLSVVLYLFIPFVYVKTAPSVGDRASEQRKLHTQRKLMKTLGISAVFTLVFYVLPNLAKVYLVAVVPVEVWEVVAPYTTCLTLVNPLANFFLYTLRHAEMKTAVLGLFPCHKQNIVQPTSHPNMRTAPRI